MNDTFTSHAESRGEKGKKWLKNIPTLVKDFEKKWGLKVSPPFELSYNYVASTLREDGTPAVLKIGFPKDRQFQSEINALEVFGGRGAVKLLEADRDAAVILIDQVLPGTPLSSVKDDDEATRIIASVIRTLIRPLPEKSKFISISEWTREVSDFLKNPPKDTLIPLPLVKKANDTFEELIATSADPVLVHGDLHHDNILKSDKEGWVAIDPKGIASEREYETAAMIRNPYNKLRNTPDLTDLLRKRIQILSAELNFNPKRIRKWGFAQSVLSGVWNDQGVKNSEHSIMIAQILLDLKI